MPTSRRSIYRLAAGSIPFGVALLVAATSGPPLLVADIAAVPFRSCSDEEPCNSWEHRMIQPPMGRFVHDEHTCNAPTYHAGPPCSGFAYSPDDVLGATVEQLAKLVDTPDSNVIWNEDRGAIQVLGCYDDVMASVPVNNAEFRHALAQH
jgi:hypothetical protein